MAFRGNLELLDILGVIAILLQKGVFDFVT